MNVGIDATTWLLRRGFGRHTRCLLTALLEVDRETRYVLFVDSPEAEAALPDGATSVVVPSATPTIAAATAHGRRSVTDVLRMSRALSDPSLDALIFPTLFSYVPVWSRARRIVFMHDVTAERYPELALRSRPARFFWSLKTRLGRSQADVLVTVSEHSRAGIAERFGLRAESVHVVGEASDPVFRVLEHPTPTPRLRELGVGCGRRSVVHLGGFSPHKNLGTLVSVFSGLATRDGFDDVDLVFVGDCERETFVTDFEKLRAQVDALGLTDRVIFTGFLPDDELVVALNLATVLVLPSLNEGFGLPAIEAAACGCPVIASRCSPLPGLMGDAARYVDPRRPDELADALADVLTSADARGRMRARGLEVAGRLSWRAPAEQLARIVRDQARAN